MKPLVWRSSISAKLAIMQFLTGLAIFLIFGMLLYWSGFRPYKESRVEGLTQLGRFAVNEYRKTGPVDSVSARTFLTSLLQSSPDLMTVGIDAGSTNLVAGIESEMEFARSNSALAGASTLFEGNRLYIALDIPDAEQPALLWMISDTTRLQQRQQFVLIWGCILFVVAVALAIFAAGPVSRSISRRIRLLARNMSGTEATGDMGKPVPVQGSDEVTILMSGFNRLMERLKDDEKRKDQFIGIVSHELRTPLTVVKGYLELLQDNADSRSSPLLINAQRNLGKLERLTKDLLEVSRIQTGTFRCREDLVDLTLVLNQAVTDMQLAYTRRQIEFDAPRKSYFVIGDEERLGQVICKMIGNALKFSPEKEKVVVSYSIHPSSIRVDVRDFGQGILPGDQSLIFDKFARPSTFNPRNSGFGVGLYISKAIIESHKGEIGVEDSEGGSTFFFVLPLQA